MKIKFICAYLRIAYIFANLKFILSHHVSKKNQLQFYKHNQHQPFQNHFHQILEHNSDGNLQSIGEFAKAKDYKNYRICISSNIEPGIYGNDNSFRSQNRFIDADLKQLAEFAKDPKNLKNGIYHDGAVTYDLGLPNYEILNPYETPEIITPDHPHYQEQLNQIQLTNNITAEDFGRPSILSNDIITDKPEPSTTTLEAIKSLSGFKTTTVTSSPLPLPSPSRPMKKHINNRDNIDEHIKKAKEKTPKLKNKIELKQNNKKINATLKNVIKNRKLTPTFCASTDRTITRESNDDTYQPQSHPHNSIPISIEMFDKDDNFLKNFYGQSVLLASPPSSPEIESQHFENTLLSFPYINSGQLAYLSSISSGHMPTPVTTIGNFDTSYYMSTERNVDKSSALSDSVP